MSILAEKFKQHMDSKEIRYEYFEATEERSEAIKIAVSGKQKADVTVFFFFDHNGRTVAVKSFHIAKVGEDKLAGAPVAVNELNAHYRWVKFYWNEDLAVTASGDLIVDESSVGDECFEILLRTMQIIDEAYPVLMKVIWG